MCYIASLHALPPLLNQQLDPVVELLHRHVPCASLPQASHDLPPLRSRQSHDQGPATLFELIVEAMHFCDVFLHLAQQLRQRLSIVIAEVHLKNLRRACGNTWPSSRLRLSSRLRRACGNTWPSMLLFTFGAYPFSGWNHYSLASQVLTGLIESKRLWMLIL